MKTKAVIIFSDLSRAVAHEWFCEDVNRKDIDLSFVFLNAKPSETAEFIKKLDFPVHYIKFAGKSDLPMAVLSLMRLFFKMKPDVVHTHLFGASLAGLFAARIMSIPRRIHTRHHSNFHHDYFPKAVKYDKLINWLSTEIIATDEVVKSVLVNKEGVPAKKVRIVNLGFKLNYFSNVEKSISAQVRDRYGIPEDHTVIGMVSRLIKWKGIQYVLPAVDKLFGEDPSLVLVIANANGPDKQWIEDNIRSMIHSDRVILVPFEQNMPALYKLMDYFVHVPINNEIEAFGQIYVEAMAAGIPSVVTLSGIANEYVVDRENALVVDYCNSEDIYNALRDLMHDSQLKKSIIDNARQSISKFNFEDMVHNLESVYLETSG